MSENFDENVASLFQKSLPLVTSLMVMLLSFTPVNLTLFSNIRPDLGLLCIYFWMLHRPDLFGVGSVVVMGGVYAFISSALPGASLFAYLLMYVLVYNTQKFFYAKPFIVVWYGFMALSLAAIMVKWLVVSIFYSHSMYL
jgi:rod shape-determining protein MreD